MRRPVLNSLLVFSKVMWNWSGIISKQFEWNVSVNISSSKKILTNLRSQEGPHNNALGQVTQGKPQMVTGVFVVGQRPTRLSTAVHRLLSTQGYSLALPSSPLHFYGSVEQLTAGERAVSSHYHSQHGATCWLAGRGVLKALTLFLLFVVHYYSAASLLTQHKGFIFQSEES